MWKFLEMQVMLFLFMVYLNESLFCKMQNGRTYSDWSCGDQRRDTIFLQKTQNGCASRLWRTCNQHYNYKGGWCGSADVNDENIPVAHRLERSLLKRGVTRRAYQICILETRYPQKNGEDAAEPPEPSPCQSENNASEQARSVYGNKSIAKSGEPVQEKKPCSKRVCRNNRRPSNDAVCCRVFQALGDDLIVEWLTPEEVHNTEIAFECDFDWGRAWHCGKVKDKAVASRIQYDLQTGLRAEFMLEKYNKDLAFSAFWYLLRVGEIERLADKFKHFKTIRKLCRFLS